MGPRAADPLGRRVRVLAILLGAGVVLVVLRLMLPGSSASTGGSLDGPAFRRELGAAMDSLLDVYRIDRRGIRTRSVAGAHGAALRTEQRIDVGEGFVALRFNHDLATRLRWTGARVVGTERVRERLTALHIVRGGATVWTLLFVQKAGV
jgi:hypothetical protein